MLLTDRPTDRQTDRQRPTTSAGLLWRKSSEWRAMEETSQLRRTEEDEEERTRARNNGWLAGLVLWSSAAWGRDIQWQTFQIILPSLIRFAPFAFSTLRFPTIYQQAPLLFSFFFWCVNMTHISVSFFGEKGFVLKCGTRIQNSVRDIHVNFMPKGWIWKRDNKFSCVSML